MNLILQLFGKINVHVQYMCNNSLKITTTNDYSKTSDSGHSDIHTCSINKLLNKGHSFKVRNNNWFPIVIIHFETQRREQPLYK